MTVSESKESCWRALGDVVGRVMTSLESHAADERPKPVRRNKR